MQNKVTVIGAGLAGCEAAWQLAERGIPVVLHEMKPEKRSEAHHSDDFAELVCSNSLRSNELTNAAGLLKEELRRLGGLIVACADANQVEAGGALAVDREAFAKAVTEKVKNHPLIEVVYGEVTELPVEGHVIVATGPLTSDALFDTIHAKVGGDFLHFFDAAAPIVTFESIDMENAYFASRYDKGTPDYINCPLSREQFDPFWEALTTAEAANVHGFEDKMVFEGCMPIEVNARRGHDTLLFGILKPVGLPDPKTGRDPYAVLQLRRDNAQGSLYNLVGCQTHLKWGEQKRIFSMIPALANAEYVRYGVMHRNTFIDSPRLLDHNFALREDPRIRFAGQMTGVEGYIESNASGFLAGLATACEILGKDAPDFPSTTAIGALGNYISNETVVKFQPMNINFGILDPLGYKVKGKREKNMKISERALEIIDGMKGSFAMKIAIDVMGGDNAPLAPVLGGVLAAKAYGEEVVLVGQEEVIRGILKEQGAENTPGLSIVHAPDVVDMHDDPATVLRQKPESSMAVALKLVKNGEADAIVSAGSTGALLSGATLFCKRIKGIRRAALAPVMPCAGGQVMLVDAGANTECTAEYLLQFAYLGSMYAEKIRGIEKPRVGLVNNGSEDSKGDAMRKETYALLREAHEAGRINFVGNVEGSDVPGGKCDVAVCDGFAGNVMLKTIEGVAKFMAGEIKKVFMRNVGTKLAYLACKKGMDEFKDLFNQDAIGGAPFLGIAHPVIKAHGSSNEIAFMNAVRQAIAYTKSGMIETVQQNIAHMVIEK